MWVMEALLFNYFMMMRRYCSLKVVRQLFKHHEFNELIGRALLDPINEWPKRMKVKRTTETGERKLPPTTGKKSSEVYIGYTVSH